VQSEIFQKSLEIFENRTPEQSQKILKTLISILENIDQTVFARLFLTDREIFVSIFQEELLKYFHQKFPQNF